MRGTVNPLLKRVGSNPTLSKRWDSGRLRGTRTSLFEASHTSSNARGGGAVDCGGLEFLFLNFIQIPPREVILTVESFAYTKNYVGSIPTLPF
jgi:hypothetical protein